MKHPYATACKVIKNKVSAGLMRTSLGAPERSRICMFHDIVVDGAALPDEYACTMGQFAQIVDAYREQGLTFIPLDKLLDMPYSAAKSGYCVITLDDGFSSAASLAAPYLIQAGIPFTLYVSTGLLGQDGYLNESQLAELAAKPLCTIGSHLVTHSMTRFMPTDLVMQEMIDSKAALERMTGKPVIHMAFPYGSAYACSMRDARLAKQCGYRSASFTTPTNYHRFRLLPDYTLPRVNMPAQFSCTH